MDTLDRLHRQVCEALEAGAQPAEMRRRILALAEEAHRQGLTATAAAWRELAPQ